MKNQDAYLEDTQKQGTSHTSRQTDRHTGVGIELLRKLKGTKKPEGNVTQELILNITSQRTKRNLGTNLIICCAQNNKS